MECGSAFVTRITYGMIKAILATQSYALKIQFLSTSMESGHVFALKIILGMNILNHAIIFHAQLDQSLDIKIMY